MGLIKTQNLWKCYQSGAEKVEALRGLDLSLEAGEFLAIVGPSGSGKSTLLTALGGLAQPTKGKVIVDNIDIYALPSERLADFRSQYLGFVFQNYQLIPYLTVLENVLLPLAIVSKNGNSYDLAWEILEKVGVKEKARRLPSQLSGGEQQRVAIARALINAPAIILADEPTGNLDSHTGQEIMELLQSLNAEGKTIIIVTHNPEAQKFVRRVVTLADGQMVKD
jgi:putative ABC transport system ATP-binding protein